MMTSKEWITPDIFFKRCSVAFGKFDLDVAADENNAKCDLSLTEGDNALSINWSKYLSDREIYTKHIWCNPPYHKLISWVSKSIEEAERGCTVVMLLPWGRWAKWHELIVRHAEMVRVVGRIQFELDGKTPSNAPSCNILAIMRPTIEGFRFPTGFTNSEIDAK